MKFRIIVGSEQGDGLLTYGANTFLHLPLVEETDPEWNDIWAINYDDTVVPVLNDVEVSPPEAVADPSGGRPTRDLFLSADEITYFTNWVETKAASEIAVMQSNQDAITAEANDHILNKYKDWNEYQGVDSNRMNRDLCLKESDCYELPHLKTAEWDTFRSWLRDLPTTNPDPLTINFVPLPVGANQILKRAYEAWRVRINQTIAIKG